MVELIATAWRRRGMDAASHMDRSSPELLKQTSANDAALRSSRLPWIAGCDEDRENGELRQSIRRQLNSAIPSVADESS
jgi:hypothetical protein